MPLAPHAEPFYTEPTATGPDGQRVGVLVSHGFTGSPAGVMPWGRALAAEGFGVSVPRLPGHGTSWREMNRTGWADWYGEIERSFEKLRADCDQVVAAGLSMGGSLVLQLAAERGREVAGLVLVNPAVTRSRKDELGARLLKGVVPSLPGIVNDIKKPGQDEHGYPRTPLRAAAQMMAGWKRLREALPRVTQPILLFRSAEDHVVDPASAREIRRLVSSRELEERILADSYHVATLDNDAPQIFAETAAFVRRVTGP